MSSPTAQLHQRCHGLGLPAWQFDGEAHVQAEPVDFGLAQPWLQSKPLRRELTEAARLMLAKPDPQPMTLFTGASLVPVVERRRHQRDGLTLVLLLRPEALASKCFERLCHRANLEALDTANWLRGAIPGLKPDGLRHDIAQVQEVLDWSLTDLARAEDDRQTIEQFSQKLMQSYEEVSLMYRLGQSMRGLSDPVRLMRQTCDELRSVLPMEWVGSAFCDKAGTVNQLRRQVFHAGTIPVNEMEFEHRTSQFIASQPVDWQSARVVSDLGRTTQKTMDGKMGLVATRGPDADPSQWGRLIVAPLRYQGEVVGALLAGGKDAEDPEPSSADIKLLGAAADFLSVFHENLVAFAEQKTLFLGTVQALTASIDAKDTYTRGHSQRVALLSRQLAQAVGLSTEEVERAHITGLVHDVGKIGIPEAVLGKPGKLSDDEFDQIKQHPTIGHRILSDIPPLGPMLPGVRHHHERIDGRGYPDGLSGDKIPLLGRLIGVADTFDAMSSTRSYRQAMPRANVLTEMQQSAGTQLDADLTAAFVHLNLTEYDHMLSHHEHEHLRHAA